MIRATMLTNQNMPPAAHLPLVDSCLHKDTLLAQGHWALAQRRPRGARVLVPKAHNPNFSTRTSTRALHGRMGSRNRTENPNFRIRESKCTRSMHTHPHLNCEIQIFNWCKGAGLAPWCPVYFCSIYGFYMESQCEQTTQAHQCSWNDSRLIETWS